MWPSPRILFVTRLEGQGGQMWGPGVAQVHGASSVRDRPSLCLSFPFSKPHWLARLASQGLQL